MNKHHVAAAFRAWLPLAFLGTALCLLVYAAVQQDYRQSANDPQIQLAEDAAVAVGGGTTAQNQSLSFEGNVDIGASLAPYLVFYNDAGTPTGGNGFLDGRFPLLPSSLFDYVRAVGETRVTWQPEAGIRQAIVVARIGGAAPGFVMAGRSLREVEVRENMLGIMALATWTATLLGLFLVTLGLELASRKNPR